MRTDPPVRSVLIRNKRALGRKIQLVLALVIAFASVYFFFFKILFF